MTEYVVCEKCPALGYRVLGCYEPYLSKIKFFNNYEEAETFMNALKIARPDGIFCIKTIKSYL